MSQPKTLLSESAVIPVVLAGGKGTRLWPLSNTARPKQFLSLIDEHSLLESTLMRCSLLGGKHLLVVGNFEHRFLLGEQVHRVCKQEEATILLEPIGRDTALPIAISCLKALKEEKDPTLCVMPADAMVLDEAGWSDAVNRAVGLASEGYLTVIGLHPTRPETGYGYIESGEIISSVKDSFRVASFKEKPTTEIAEEFIKNIKYSWNSGMFIVKASVLKKAFEQYATDTLDAAQKALDKASLELDFICLDKKSLESAPSISFDYAVMEHTKNAAVVKASFGWTDLGNWKAVKDISPACANGNVIQGNGLIHQGKHNYVKSDGKFVTVYGLDHIGVIATDDTVLVSSLDKIQDIKDLVNEVTKTGFKENESVVRRPWGSYESLAMDEGFQVKRIIVQPKKRLSLQKHHHRSEHWVVVQGEGIVTRDDEVLTLSANENVYLPLGCVHRLENPSDTKPLTLIEVQCGSYLGEDDIVRLEDDYGR